MFCGKRTRVFYCSHTYPRGMTTHITLEVEPGVLIDMIDANYVSIQCYENKPVKITTIF